MGRSSSRKPLLVLLLELPVGGGEVGELLHLGLGRFTGSTTCL